MASQLKAESGTKTSFDPLDSLLTQSAISKSAVSKIGILEVKNIFTIIASNEASPYRSMRSTAFSQVGI